jgi:endonuclease/exonuclease/phosphatase family metal-dependent hydrolase
MEVIMKKFGFFNILIFFAVLSLVCAAVINPVKASGTNSFSVLTYNVAGLPGILSSSDPSKNTIQISPILNDYDIIAVQEDFAYHTELTKYVKHQYLTPSSGNVPFGSGINFLSKYPFFDTDRETWNKRYGFLDSGSDELTPKGFMYSQYQIEPGLYIDIYTLHTDAGDDQGSYDARCDNISQISKYINTYSAGNAVIVMGDTNSRYTRSADNFETALVNNCNLKDPWIDLVRKGNVPQDGDALMDATDRNGPNFEVVDKVLYRSGKAINLIATSYKLDDKKFTDESGKQLSDHFPVSVNFSYTKNPNTSLSTAFGGPGGIAFNFLSDMTDAKPTKISINSGERVDNISFTYADGKTISKGGIGGTKKEISLANDEYISEITLCKGIKRDTSNDRIFYTEFKTNKGQILSGGTKTSDSVTLKAENGWYVSGLFGRAEDEIDKLGAIYKQW